MIKFTGTSNGMNIKIRAVNFELTPAIDDYVTKKISTLEKFLGNKETALCEVEIGRTTMHHKSGDIFRAEVNITAPNIKQIFAYAEERDLYSAIDIVRDELERLIVSRKDKRNTLFRRGGQRIKELLKKVRIYRRR